MILLTNNKTIDFEMNQQFTITFTATDQGHPSRSTSAVLVVNVTDENEYPPMFGATQYSFSDVLDTSPIGTPVGNVSAVDADKGAFGVIMYRITRVTGNGKATCTSGDGLFAISSSGVLYLNQSVNGIRCTYDVKVEVYNEGGTSQVAIATIFIPITGRLVFSDINTGGIVDHVTGTVMENVNSTFLWFVKGANNLPSSLMEKHQNTLLPF